MPSVALGLPASLEKNDEQDDQEDETAHIGDGWGQRDGYNRDRGRTIPYIVRRTKGGGAKRFVSVFEAHSPDKPYVLAVKRSSTWGGTVKLEVETRAGRDYIECTPSAFRVTSRSAENTINWKFEIDE